MNAQCLGEDPPCNFAKRGINIIFIQFFFCFFLFQNACLILIWSKLFGLLRGLLKRSKRKLFFIVGMLFPWEQIENSLLLYSSDHHVSGLCGKAFLHWRCGQRWNVRILRLISCFARKSKAFSITFCYYYCMGFFLSSTLLIASSC